jgi:Zn-dependent protease
MRNDRGDTATVIDFLEMGYQDRHYYRDSGSGAFNPLMWLVSGSVPLFTAFGIRVRAHASLVITIVLVLLFGVENGTWEDRFQSMSVLFLVVLLHEFGHCFAARWVGGEAEDILMHPLGGLAFAMPPRRWGATFITVAAGPAVNVLICLICGGILWGFHRLLPLDPFRFSPIGDFRNWVDVAHWAGWIYQVSYMLLIFNLMPIFPLDGGQMAQALLWPWFGYYKSMNFACITGMIGAIIGAGIALPTGNVMLGLLAVMGFLTCLNMRRALLANGPEEYSDATDYSAAYETFQPPTRRRRPSRWAARRALKLARAERVEQQRIDQILAKVSAQGMHSLTWLERRALRKATEHQRKRDVELDSSRRF